MRLWFSIKISDAVYVRIIWICTKTKLQRFLFWQPWFRWTQI